MALVWKLGRVVLATLGLAALALGGLGLAVCYRPEVAAVAALRSALVRGVESLAALEAIGLSADFAVRFDAALATSLLGFSFAPAGLVLLGLALLPGRFGGAVEAAEEESRFDERPQLERRLLKKARKAAAAAARRGMPLEAAEICFESGLLDPAAEHFVAAGEFVRAAEIRHDQNRFIEAAELYLRAGQPDSAGTIFARQEEYGRAAEAYAKAGNLSIAAEMYEKAEDYRPAAECYQQAGFPRHAAQAWVKARGWKQAAGCLEQVIADETTSAAAADPRRQSELRKLVRMTGNLYERSGQGERAEAVLVRGGCLADAAELALKSGRDERAAELFLEAKEGVRAAEVYQRLGRDQQAALILAEHHRDRGDEAEAARQFEAAGEFVAAGDLYRLLEQYERAAACFERQGEHLQAAEMFCLAGLRDRAGESYERAGHYAEAAECHALAGNTRREAELLALAGQHLRAGELFRAEGDSDQAIKVLQQVEPGGADGPAASALLGEIFRERGMLSLAVKKLGDAVDGQEIDRGNVRVFYELATVFESENEWAKAAELYEKILAFDYHYQDAGDRLARAREEAAQAPSSSPGSDAPSPSGAQARYRITGKLGRGGMGIVYRAEDTVLDRTVAFKVLPESLKENPQALKNFLREAKSAARLNHPNIVTVYDAGEQDGVYYIAMEYVDGNTLKDIVRHKGRISPGGIVHVLAQMCEALAYAHEKKIVHRDIKTANTMWTRDRKAKIMDFGLAKVIEEVRNHTTVVSGTPYYMSPEQTLGKNVDHRTDLYSLGVTIFELATGTLPFREGNLPYHHVHTPPPDPRELNPELPPGLAEIILRCLRKDREERYQSAGEILSDLKASLSG